MRTTLTLDDDVAKQIERLREEREVSFKELVNEALREALAARAGDRPPREPFHTTPVSLGRCLVGDLDDVSEALAIAEGEAYR
jgi:hypothetical protein